MLAASSTAGVMLLLVLSGSALAAPKVDLSARTVRPGQAVLVTVTGTKQVPAGDAGAGTSLAFFAARGGFQAVVAVPIDAPAGPFKVRVTGAPAASVQVLAHQFPEAKVIVEEEFANPPEAERARIDADNRAILTAARGATGEPLFTAKFRKPASGITSVYGEWRTFNDGHRSRHLGLDVRAAKGSPVKAINSGRVALVRECFLAGNVVVVAHGGGVASAYYHLDAATVAEGDPVTAGAVIGRAGQTGRSTGPHLHLSVYVPGGLVDPVSFFRLPFRPAPPPASPAAPPARTPARR